MKFEGRDRQDTSRYLSSTIYTKLDELTLDGDVPLFLKVGDGNKADKAVFGQIAREFKKQVDFDSLIVGDSALYSKENLKLMREMRWLSRVPFSIKEAQELVDSSIGEHLIFVTPKSGFMSRYFESLARNQF